MFTGIRPQFRLVVQIVIVPHRSKLMPRPPAALSLTALALCILGCAAISPVKNGMDEMQVQARMGTPETVRKGADGSQIWEYPGGPLGRQTYMVALGADH